MAILRLSTKHIKYRNLKKSWKNFELNVIYIIWLNRTKLLLDLSISLRYMYVVYIYYNI